MIILGYFFLSSIQVYSSFHVTHKKHMLWDEVLPMNIRFYGELRKSNRELS